MYFAWDDWNRDHIAAHGVRTGDAEHVVRKARVRRESGDGKYLVEGPTIGGHPLRVVYVLRSLEQLDPLDVDVVEAAGESRIVYVVTAYYLGPNKRRRRRQGAP